MKGRGRDVRGREEEGKGRRAREEDDRPEKKIIFEVEFFFQTFCTKTIKIPLTFILFF